MKNRVLSISLLAFLIFFSQLSHAQYDPSRVNKKAIEAYEKGLEKAQMEDYSGALKDLQEALRRDQNYVDAWLSLAGVYGQLKDAEQSVQAYEKAFAIDKNYTFDFLLPYAINLARLGRFEDAQRTTNELLARPTISSNTRKAAEYRKKNI